MAYSIELLNRKIKEHRGEKLFYRFHDHWTGNNWEKETRCHLFVGIKQTPKGWWIIPCNEMGYHPEDQKKRWVSDHTDKRYAYPTKEEAMKNYLYRKGKQIQIIKGNLRGAYSAYQSAKYWMDEIEKEQKENEEFLRNIGAFDADQHTA